MKHVLLILTLCLISIPSFASSCNDSLIEKGEQTLRKVQAEESLGMSSHFDFLMAEKNVLELKLCQNKSDTETFVKLVDNVNARYILMNRYFDSGFVTSLDVTFVKNEKLMYQNNCHSLLDYSKKKYDNGGMTAQELSALTKACESL